MSGIWWFPLQFGSTRSLLDSWLFMAACGLVQLGACAMICSALERRYPLVTWDSRHPFASDVVYAVMVRLIVFPAIVCVEYPFLHEAVMSASRRRGMDYGGLSHLLVAGYAGGVLCFALSFVVLDFADYWKHRLSHRYGWWYGLHSVHHAEEQLTFLSDERSHILEDVITFAWFIAFALLADIPTGIFPFAILAIRSMATIAHSNTRIAYGPVLERIFVSPRFHRAHHALHPITKRSMNIGTALPLWDVCFGTADFAARTVDTGDSGASRALAAGSWGEQQVEGMRRMLVLAKRKRKSGGHA